MKKGQVVYSTAGRDKNRFLAVVGFEGGYCLVVDGKERPLERPKRKNMKHLNMTDRFLEEQCYRSNRSVRAALKAVTRSEKMDSERGHSNV